MREEAELQAAQTMVNINPHASHRVPSNPYATGSYSNASSTVSSAPLSANTLKTSAESHHSSHSDYDGHPSSAPVKQSLPSIHEALASRPDDDAIRPAPRSPEPRHTFSRRYSSPSPTRGARSHATQDRRYEQYPMQQSHSQYEPSARPPRPSSPRSYAPVNSGARPPSPPEHYSPPASRSAQQYPPVPHSQPSPRATPQYGHVAQSATIASSPFPYTSRQTSTTYAPTSSHEYVTSYPAVSTSAYGSAREAPWHSDEVHNYARAKVEPRESQFPSTVKRKLDHYDLDSLLNEIHDCSHNLMQFSEVYRVRDPRSQRSDNIARTPPTISDVHHAMKFNAKITEALDFTLQQLRADEAERVERETREAARRQRHADHVDGSVSGTKREHGEGAYAGPDPKKRRGRAAPPGRCHACNRAETPEWRRGPDGARTLCNACGLHYAKHTRKMGAQKAAAIQQGSNLRPKSAGQN